MGRGVEGGGVGEGGLLGTTGVGAEGEGVWREDGAGQPRPGGTHLTLTPVKLVTIASYLFQIQFTVDSDFTLFSCVLMYLYLPDV